MTEQSEAGSESAGIMIGFLVLAITLGLARGRRPAAAHGDPRGGDLGGAVTALTGALELTETAPTLATMLGLAVGIDYALFILSRHRQNIHDGWSRARRRPRQQARWKRRRVRGRPW